MKITLSQNIVLKLTLDEMPVSNNNGKLVFEKNLKQLPYILFDDHRDAPIGFGIKVAKTKKTYLIQRRVSSSKVIKAKVGNVSDFFTIDAARSKARELVQIAQASKQNPNNITREKNANEITLAEAFTKYREHLLGRKKRATENTLKVLDKALNRINEWCDRKIRDLASNEIISKFDEIANPHRTAAEQTFRWAIAVTNYAIEMEEHDAATQQRSANLNYNPFLVLNTNKKFRSRRELEDSYRAKNVRKPLSYKDSLGNWLNAILSRRGANRTGCDYLLLTTLWGTRKSEALDLKWRDKISDKEAEASSWVDLKSRKVHFFDTKNRSDFDLPIADAAYEILMQRYENTHENIQKNAIWVFPAKSKHSKIGHYTDMKTLLSYVCNDANIAKIGMHDLRRTFGRVADELTSYSIVKQLLNHQTLSDVTGRYIDVEWSRLSEAMQRIELYILKTAPEVYNLLLTPKYQPITAILSKSKVENEPSFTVTY